MSHQAWARYHQLLHDHPVATNSVTAGVMAFTGDVIAQSIERTLLAEAAVAGSPRRADAVAQPPVPYSATRGLTMFGWGVSMGGTVMHWWFSYLARLGGTPVTLPKVLGREAGRGS